MLHRLLVMILFVAPGAVAAQQFSGLSLETSINAPAATDMARWDDRLYLWANNRIVTYDVSDPALPILLGTTHISPLETQQDFVAIYKHYLFVGREVYSSIIEIFNLMSPNAVTKVGQIELGGPSNQSIYPMVEGKSLYVSANPFSGLKIFDLSGNPSNPILVKTIEDRAYYAFDVFQGTLVTKNSVYDISNPMDAIPLFNLGSPWGDFTIRPDRIATNGEYFAIGLRDVIEIRMRQPGRTVLLGDIHTVHLSAFISLLPEISRHNYPLEFDRNLLWVGGAYGLRAYDYKNLTHPNPVRAAYESPSIVTRILFHNNHIFALNYGNGVAILRKQVVYPPDDCVNDFMVVQLDYPAGMAPGATGEIAVTVRNSGDCDWRGLAAYKLAIEADPGDLVQLPYDRVNIPYETAVASEDSFAFSLPLRAPEAPGVYNVTLRMVREYQEFFGAPVTISIEVGAQGETQLKNAARIWRAFE